MPAGRLLAHMRASKKRRDGRLVFILAQGIGRACIRDDVPEDAVLSLLRTAGCGE